MTARRLAVVPWIALVLGLVAMLPGFAQRVQTEGSSTAYEIAVAYPELTTLRLGSIETGAALDELTAAGLTTVAVDMQTLRDLERDGRVTLLDRADLLSLLLLSGEAASAMPDEGDAFLLLADDDPAIVDRIRRAVRTGEIVPITVGGQPLYRVSGIEDLINLPLGYDHEQVRELTQRGLEVIARVPETLKNVDFGTEELAALRDEFGIRRLILLGERLPFAIDPQGAAEFITWLREEQFSVFLLEFSTQVGTPELVAAVGPAGRLRLVGLSPDFPMRTISDAVRAIRERNIRVLELRSHQGLDAIDRLDMLTRAGLQIQEAAPSEFRLAKADAPAAIEASPLHMAGAALASAGIAAAAVGLVSPIIGLAAGGVVGLMVLGMVVTGSAALGDITRLGVAGLAALLAVFVARPRAGLAAASIEYAKAGVVVIAGGLTVAGLAQGTLFFVGARDFWGVKALLIGPPLAAAAVAAYVSLNRPGLLDASPILNLPLRIWHVMAFLAVAGAAGFMLLRSGNTGIQIDVELLFREQLESLFTIRPRTKEFLLGWPALLLGVLAAFRSRHGWWLYVVAAIATASAVDTFTHFHSPLLVSLVRTVYGLALGFAAGVIGLAVIRLLAGPLVRFVRSSSP